MPLWLSRATLTAWVEAGLLLSIFPQVLLPVPRSSRFNQAVSFCGFLIWKLCAPKHRPCAALSWTNTISSEWNCGWTRFREKSLSDFCLWTLKWAAGLHLGESFSTWVIVRCGRKGWSGLSQLRAFGHAWTGGCWQGRGRVPELLLHQRSVRCMAKKPWGPAEIPAGDTAAVIAQFSPSSGLMCWLLLPLCKDSESLVLTCKEESGPGPQQQWIRGVRVLQSLPLISLPGEPSQRFPNCGVVWFGFLMKNDFIIREWIESNVGQIVRHMNDSYDICSVSIGAGLFRWFLSFFGKCEDD